jgi:hypothetical protein
MAKRNSISVKGLTYQRIKDYLATLPPPVKGEKPHSSSGFLEKLILAKLGPETEEDRRKFGEVEEARVRAQEEKQPEPPPAPDPAPEPVEAAPEPAEEASPSKDGAMPRGPLPEFSESERNAPKKRPAFMQPKKMESVDQEEKDDDDPDAIPPAIRFF